MKSTLFLHYTGIFQRVKKKMVGILVYAKLMIILQICHRVIFVLKNKTYNIKYSDFKGCVRFFFFKLKFSQCLQSFTKNEK